MGNMAKALEIVALYPLATLGMSVCSTTVHRCTAAQWSAGRRSIIVGTEVLGWGCCVNQEELLSSSYCVHCSYHLLPHFSWQAPHVHLLQDLALDHPFKQVLGILVRAGGLHLQGLELGQEVIYPLAGALSKIQELGPCPLLVVPWEEEILDLHLEICPCGPSIGHHALIEANLCIMACTRSFQMQEYRCCLFLVGGSGMGGCDPDLGLRPPLMKLLWRPIVKFGSQDNFLRMSGPSSCLHGDVLLQGVVEGLLPIGKLEDDVIPVSHCY